MITDIHVNVKDGIVIVKSMDDVEAVLEHNKKLRSLEQKSDWGRHIALIPPIAIKKWLDDEANRGHYVRFLGKEFDELCEKKLKDPDWAFLRTDGPQHRTGWSK